MTMALALTPNKRPRGPLVLALLVAALCLRSLSRTPSTIENESYQRSSLRERRLAEEERRLVEEKAEARDARDFERFLHERFLQPQQHVSTTSLEADELGEFGEDYDAAAKAGGRDDESSPTETEAQASHDPPPTVARYDVEDVLAESRVWRYAFCILAYDPARDKFTVHLNRRQTWASANNKLFRAVEGLVVLLRSVSPGSFCGAKCDELIIPVGGGDYPHVVQSLLPHEAGKAPVLMFGSSFRDTSMYPNIIAMPMPGQPHLNYLNCFVSWATSSGMEVCSFLNSKGNALVFGDDLGLSWEDLTPQVVSRVTDYDYLDGLQDKVFGKMAGREVSAESRPIAERFFDETQRRDKRAVSQSLDEFYDELVPRWKAVALTARAELDAEEEGELPWADVKLSYHVRGGGNRRPTVGSKEYRLWEDAGVAVGEAMGAKELAAYRYQIDLAGGGGTTWTGTLEKLAMPGLLFHHVSPTKDYVHDRLKPWKHYVPVRPDLKDLKAKFKWAEAHPSEAKRIADAGTAFVRHLGTPAGFGRMYDEDVAEPLRRVVEAYGSSNALSWRKALEGKGEEPVMECTGRGNRGGCVFVQNKAMDAWQKFGHFPHHLVHDGGVMST